MDISKLSVNELKNLQKEIDTTILVRKEQEKKELRHQVETLLKQHNTTIEELFGTKSSGKRAKAAPKYRNPDDPSQTWSGRGRCPNWLQAKLDTGAKKERFLIK